MKDPGPRHWFLISYGPTSVLIKRESGTTPRSVLFRRLGAFRDSGIGRAKPAIRGHVWCAPENKAC